MASGRVSLSQLLSMMRPQVITVLIEQNGPPAALRTLYCIGTLCANIVGEGLQLCNALSPRQSGSISIAAIATDLPIIE
jgi:hypothetical protein